MSSIKNILLTAIALFTVCPLLADNVLLSQSTDPKMDEQYIRKVKKHLDNVRRAQNRPTVALVLCGGGAKGAAEVGAIKYIEETGIPIDFVCGTSIGALIGGLYCVGYGGDVLDSLFRQQDWSLMLSDKVGPEDIPIEIKRLNSRYQLRIPFSFGQKVFSKFKGKEYTSTMLSSLPAGYVTGLNINNMFSALTAGYHDSLSFTALPIPFGCVSTELVSCKAKYFGSGVLKTAMRSSMGIPGLFKPVRTEDMILTDGGTRDNFPVDMARSAGADIIIGIDLSDPLPSYEKINNVGTVLGSLINMLVETSHKEQIEMTDIYIRPDLKGYTSLSFNAEAVDTLMSSGYRAALEHEEELLEVKRKTGDARTEFHNRKAVNLYENSVRLSEISFDGISEADSRELIEKTGLDVRNKVNAYDIEKAVRIIQGTGAVESVTYSLLGAEEPFRLVFNCVMAPKNRFSVGGRIDTEVWAEIALNLGINVNKLSGSKLDLNVTLGKTQSADVRYTLDFPHFPALNVEASVANINGFLRKFGDDMIFFPTGRYDCNYFTHEEKFFISSSNQIKFKVQAGLRNRGYVLNNNRSIYELFSSAPGNGNYLGCYARGEYFTFDDNYFPNRGVDLKLGVDHDFLKSGVKTFKPITTVAADFKFVIPCGDYFAIIPDIHYRSVFDKYANVTVPVVDTRIVPEFSIAHRLFLGGDIQGRYIENQVPFVGFNYVNDCSHLTLDNANYTMHSMDHLAVVNLDLRTKVYKNLYLSALGGYARMGQSLPEFFRGGMVRNCYGAALKLSYNSVIGPIQCSVSWGNRTNTFKSDIGFYLSIGFVF